MPCPLPVPLRQEIVRRHQQGIPLTRIAADLAIPYGTVRKVWRLFRRHGLDGLIPRYRGHGRPVPPATRELLRIACELKREHPAALEGVVAGFEPAPIAGATALCDCGISTCKHRQICKKSLRFRHNGAVCTCSISPLTRRLDPGRMEIRRIA